VFGGGRSRGPSVAFSGLEIMKQFFYTLLLTLLLASASATTAFARPIKIPPPDSNTSLILTVFTALLSTL
jgi:hypothetical protein